MPKGVARPTPQPRFEDTDPSVFDNWLESVLKTGKRSVNTAADFFLGGTPEEQAQIGMESIFNPAIMAPGSPLRSPVVRRRLLDSLQKQVDRLDSRYRPSTERLMETHPRLLSAFQQAGGILDMMDPGSPLAGRPAGVYDNLLRPTPAQPGAQLPGILRGRQAAEVAANAPRSPYFTSFKGTPKIQFEGGPSPSFNPATVVPHEFAHFAQDLGGHGITRHRIDLDAHMRNALDTNVLLPRFPMANRMRETMKFKREARRLRALPGEHELGAERAAIRQRERFERWKRGEPDWDQYKGPGHEQEARHLTLDEAEPGKLTGRKFGAFRRN
jgi:hypothetical protein